jgi:parallel beta-helix repeat protein
MSYLDLGYSPLLNKRKPLDFSKGINVGNVEELISGAILGFSQLAIQKFRPNQDIQSEDFVSGSSGWRIKGDGTIEAQVIIAGAYIQVFVQASIPTSVHINDVWYDSDDDYHPYQAVIAGADEIKAGEWVSIRDGTIATAQAAADAAQADATTAIADAATAQGTADGKVITFYQAGVPTALAAGDLWIDTDDGNKLYRATAAGDDEIGSGEWIEIQDDAIATAIADAATAQSTADGKIVTFYQSGIPTATDAGDLWVDTDDDKIYRSTAEGDDEITAGEWVRITGALTNNDSVDLSSGEVTNKNADNITAARNYDAVVAASGGDYTDIQAAIDAGKTNIFVRKGTYSLSADIVLLSGVSIYGEDKYDTIINLNGDNQVKAVGDTPYSTGTIAVTNGGTTVTGSGTSWSANLAEGDYIAIWGKNIYKIASITDNTHLELDVNYEGDTISGIAYEAGTFKHNISITGITIKGHNISSFKGALYFYAVVNSLIKDVILTDNDLSYSYGIFLDYSYNNKLLNIWASNNGYAGIRLQNSDWNILNNIDANNNGYYGLWIGTAANDNHISNIIANSNNYAGLIIQTSEFNQVSNVNADGNVGYGVQLSGGYYNVLSNIQAKDNGEDGIYLGSAQYSILTSLNIFRNAKNGTQINAGGRNIVSGIFKDNSKDANDTYSEILLTNTTTYNTIAKCNINCTDTNKAAYGIREAAAADDYNLIHGNIVAGAVTANISTQGANTEKKDNLGEDDGSVALGANNANTYFNRFIKMVEANWTLTNITFTENADYVFIESSNSNWRAATKIMGTGSDSDAQFDDGKTYKITFRARAVNGTAGDRRIGFARDIDDFDDAYNAVASSAVLFSMDGGTLYAHTEVSAGGTTTDISSGITVTDWNLYEIEFIQGTSAKFYVNGSLKTTITANLPGLAQIMLFGFGGETDTEDLEISDVAIQQEL